MENNGSISMDIDRLECSDKNISDTTSKVLSFETGITHPQRAAGTDSILLM